MCDVGVSIDKFNPEILFLFSVDNKDYINTTYHCHDFIEFSYVVSGAVTYRINDKYYKVKEKTLLPFNPNVYHKESLNIGDSATELHIGFRNLQIEGLPLNTVISENYEGPLEFKQFKEDFHKCCLEIIEEQNACEVGKELILKKSRDEINCTFLKRNKLCTK